jgi:hypothetical protein
VVDHAFGAADLRGAWPVLVWNGTRFVPFMGSSAY